MAPHAFIFNLLAVVSLFCLVSAGSSVERSEDDGIIDLSKLGPRLYGVPSESAGDLVAKWNSSMKMNVDEIGNYLEGDILHLSSVTRSGLRFLSARWPKGVVPFVMSSYFNFTEWMAIRFAFSDIQLLTCIKFVQRTTEPDYIDITATNTGCWSSIGRIGGAQKLNLQRPECASSKGVILHELMHALGFIHEHTRPDRDEYVGIIYRNIETDALDSFAPIPEDMVNDYGVEYDYGSIMHPSAYASSKNEFPTILPYKSCTTIGQRVGLSYGDVRKIKAMYKCRNY